MEICHNCSKHFCNNCIEKIHKGKLLEYFCPSCFEILEKSKKKAKVVLKKKRNRKSVKLLSNEIKKNDSILDMDFLIEKLGDSLARRNTNLQHVFIKSQPGNIEKMEEKKPKAAGKEKKISSKSISNPQSGMVPKSKRIIKNIQQTNSNKKNINSNLNNTNLYNADTFINCQQCKKIQELSKVFTCSNPECRESFCFCCLKKMLPKLTKDNFMVYKSQHGQDWKCPKCTEMETFAKKSSKSSLNFIEEENDEFNVLNNKKYLHKLINTAKYCEVFFSQKHGDCEEINKKCFICQKRYFCSNEMLRFSSHRDLLQYLKYTFIYQGGIMNYDTTAFEKNKHDIASYTKNVKIDYYRPWKFKYTKLVCKFCFLKLVNSNSLIEILENKFVDQIKQKKKKKTNLSTNSFTSGFLASNYGSSYAQNFSNQKSKNDSDNSAVDSDNDSASENTIHIDIESTNKEIKNVQTEVNEPKNCDEIETKSKADSDLIASAPVNPPPNVTSEMGTRENVNEKVNEKEKVKEKDCNIEINSQNDNTDSLQQDLIKIQNNLFTSLNSFISFVNKVNHTSCSNYYGIDFSETIEKYNTFFREINVLKFGFEDLLAKLHRLHNINAYRKIGIFVQNSQKNEENSHTEYSRKLFELIKESDDLKNKIQISLKQIEHQFTLYLNELDSHKKTVSNYVILYSILSQRRESSNLSINNQKSS